MSFSLIKDYYWGKWAKTKEHTSHDLSKRLSQIFLNQFCHLGLILVSIQTTLLVSGHPPPPKFSTNTPPPPKKNKQTKKKQQKTKLKRNKWLVIMPCTPKMLHENFEPAM